jgi:hypothetical protein
MIFLLNIAHLSLFTKSFRETSWKEANMTSGETHARILSAILAGEWIHGGDHKSEVASESLPVQQAFGI